MSWNYLRPKLQIFSGASGQMLERTLKRRVLKMITAAVVKHHGNTDYRM